MSESINELIDKLLSDHKFGEPWRLGERNAGIVVPILRRRTPTKRGYLMLEEAKDRVHIKDTGSIERADVQAHTDKPVFIRGGGILKSEATQPRAVRFGVIVLPEKRQTIPVQCVHASKGITPSAFFTVSNYTPPSVSKALYSGQNHTWQAVSRYTTSARQSLSATNVSTHFAPDNLVQAVETIERFKTDVEEALKKIPADLENQVGVAIFDLDGVAGIEVFDHPKSWHALSQSVMRQYKDVLVEQKVPSYLKIDMNSVVGNIKSFLEEAKSIQESEVYRNNGAKTSLVKNDNIVGECTWLQGKMIHLLLTRREGKSETAPKRERWQRNWRDTGTPIPHVHWYTTTAPAGYPRGLRRQYELLSEIRDEEKTWADLKTSFTESTLHRRLKSGIKAGLIERRFRARNGKPVYRLTALGKQTFKKLKQSADDF